YPDRAASDFDRLDFFTHAASLTFEKPDVSRFRNLSLAFEAIRQGGNMPCILNAANEVVVQGFLQNRISFLRMSDVIERTMQHTPYIAKPVYDDYVQTDAEARRMACEYMA
ncbi:MAG: 1-deoxy-D-xylulose-5-phosphate reductoisomerase, partial [Paludibacteraceae bacterium]|nr:1-deoxy-D-xylulose-5-phosphate reductoisomerase [Paludibacteraceae bacterium]